MVPTDKGCIITNITIYSSGVIDLQTQPLDTPKRRTWLANALDTVKRDVLGKGKRKRKA
jgi:hypothetical protein